jgi:apolipoprotein N-acyltransferase
LAERGGPRAIPRSPALPFRGALALASAAACVLAAPPFDAWPLALVCWALLVVAVDGVGLSAALALGLLQGIATTLGTQGWIFTGLRESAALGWVAAAVGTALFALGQGMRSAMLAGLLTIGRARGWSPAALLPVVLVSVELVHPMLFPWFTGILVHSRPALLQLAEWGGPLAVSAWLALVNGFVAEALLRRGAAPVLRAIAGAAITLALVSTLGALRIAQVERTQRGARTLRVGVLQPDLDKRPGAKGDPVLTLRPESLELLEADPEIDLLIWPETSLQYPTRAGRLARFFRDHVLRDRRKGVRAEQISVPILVGMVLKESEASRPTNSAVLADADGRVLGIYDKQHLFPVGERAPFADWLPWMNGVLPPVTAFTTARQPAALELGDHRLLVSICYEDILHRSFRDAVHLQKPGLLINLTSDSWFDGSGASSLHFALARLRAVEHRRFLVRATNDGITAAVDPTGRVHWQLPPGDRARGATEVTISTGTTLYTRVGDAPWLFALVACGLMSWLGPSRFSWRRPL